MNHLLQSHHPIRHANSFKYAAKGVIHALMNEANFRVQVTIMSINFFLGFWFKIPAIEWAVLILSMGFLLGAEMMNTVVEEFIDHLIHEHHEGARVIKDLAAGYVLLAAFTALAVMIILFWHRLFPSSLWF